MVNGRKWIMYGYGLYEEITQAKHLIAVGLPPSVIMHMPCCPAKRSASRSVLSGIASLNQSVRSNIEELKGMKTLKSSDVIPVEASLTSACSPTPLPRPETAQNWLCDVLRSEGHCGKVAARLTRRALGG